ncbi:2,3-epoxybenzoyl-CoA dihydrolase [Actinophytocola algeriensis]|uniref:Benzoyl-CoA-dihydrodiol lyase n=1 Tax=Actinophytocola algeriensis TaxID=1768010 RepID=A0A7W7PZF9_9PSEU|nr:2,3-epoxybenzoyl-CoA dihydrolase [Actinophytocola algeriensis]MBB4904175.1 benzoyl-CoA-dihydrodiol lyase [Actinophytocola algeriensis]MBE1476968.1 benzoyl-CoA-dihydrodiol lyase [Actinophytocola algeriensis]
MVSFDTHPDRYRHWSLRVDGEVAWLVLDVDEQGGLTPGYELKLNSYDLGVDIELYDATQRLRFEHPAVRTVVVTSGKDKVFCAGANIRMLAAASHEWKVNFCKFTNETRNGMEDATANSGQTYLAAVNGSCAGGGYELALACDHIVLVDDNSSTVALPEVPLLGVLPGTGGLTRVVDKRGTRKDLADVFATRADGVKGRTAVDWKLVDELAPPRRFTEVVTERAKELAKRSARPDAEGVELTPLVRDRYVTAELGDGTVDITVHVPDAVEERRDAEFWPLAMTRELDDLILRLRTNEPERGVWLLRTEGDHEVVRGYEALLDTSDWFAREVVHYWKRTLKRLDVTSRSLIALIEPGSCFAGMLAELAFAADRQYLLDDQDAGAAGTLVLTEANFGTYPMGNGLTRLESRFWGEKSQVDTLRKQAGTVLLPDECKDLGLVTDALDDIDWADEIRIVVEGRAALSPDACTGMEANHRFVGPETIETKIFGRLSAWQNWVFVRTNASGEDGALRRYGTGKKAVFDRRRV